MNDFIFYRPALLSLLLGFFVIACGGNAAAPKPEKETPAVVEPANVPRNICDYPAAAAPPWVGKIPENTPSVITVTGRSVPVWVNRRASAEQTYARAKENAFARLSEQLLANVRTSSIIMRRKAGNDASRKILTEYFNSVSVDSQLRDFSGIREVSRWNNPQDCSVRVLFQIGRLLADEQTKLELAQRRYALSRKGTLNARERLSAARVAVALARAVDTAVLKNRDLPSLVKKYRENLTEMEQISDEWGFMIYGTKKPGAEALKQLEKWAAKRFGFPVKNLSYRPCGTIDACRVHASNALLKNTLFLKILTKREKGAYGDKLRAELLWTLETSDRQSAAGRVAQEKFFLKNKPVDWAKFMNLLGSNHPDTARLDATMKTFTRN